MDRLTSATIVRSPYATVTSSAARIAGHSSYPERVWWSRTRKNGAPRMRHHDARPGGRPAVAPRDRRGPAGSPRRSPTAARPAAPAAPDQQADDVRDDEPDEPDQAGDRDRRGRGHRGEDQEDPALALDVDAEVARRRIAEQQPVERARPKPDEQARREDERGRDERAVPTRPPRGRRAGTRRSPAGSPPRRTSPSSAAPPGSNRPRSRSAAAGSSRPARRLHRAGRRAGPRQGRR